MIKFKEKKIFIGIIVGFVFSFGLVALADMAEDSWNIGDGWLWFAEEAGGEVRANVKAPLEDGNIANKEYVEAAVFGEGGGSGGVTCVSGSKVYGPSDGDTTSAYFSPYFWCCMPNADGTDMICVIGSGYTPYRKYENGALYDF